MVLPIIPIQQADKPDCLLTCLRMVLGYYEIDISPDEFHSFLTTDPEKSSLMTDNAYFAQTKGLEVDCFAYNLYYTEPKDAELPQEITLKKLEIELDNLADKWYEEQLNSTIRAIKSGVKYIIQRPNIEVINSYLNLGIPIIASVNSPALYGIKGDPYVSHAIVLSGLENRKIHFVDPTIPYEQTINDEYLLFGILARKVIAVDSYLIAIKKA